MALRTLLRALQERNHLSATDALDALVDDKANGMPLW
jgi:hypothetical protein